MFDNSRPAKPGDERGSKNKIPPIPFPGQDAPDSSKLVLDLGKIVADTEIAAIKESGQIVFHTVGDTGGVKDGAAQETLIADTMEQDFSSDKSQQKNNPAFFYHLGDVVYYNGEEENYPVQYFRPYQFYPAPIVAIAGNHDSSPPSSQNPGGDLSQFMKVFCDSQARPLVPDFDRTSMIEPYLYFTLEAPFVKIIGLYSNNSEGPGILNPGNDSRQLKFLESEFNRAKKAEASGDTRAVLVAVHHPIFSISNDHGASPHMLKEIDALMESTKFIPDAFLSGHVHGFELFVREYQGHEIPYIICGTGGYNDDAHVHKQIRLPAQYPNDFSLTQFFDYQYGYMRVTVDSQYLGFEYVGVAKRTTSTTPQPHVLESFNVDLKSHKISTY